MKKRAIFLFAFVLIVTLVGCNGCLNSQVSSATFETQNTSSAPPVTNPLSEYLVEEDGVQYLILPISKYKVSILDEHIRYLDALDLDLLRSAEEQICNQASQYTNNVGFYLQVREEHLYLCSEVIVSLTPPAEQTDGGCGIDHEHKFFYEQITK